MASMSIFHNKKYPRLWKIHRFPLAFSENHCYYIVRPLQSDSIACLQRLINSAGVAIQIPLRPVPPCLSETAIGGFFKAEQLDCSN